MWAGLRPTRTLIRAAACRRGQIGLFKNNAPVCKRLSCFLLLPPTRARTTRTVRWTLALTPAEKKLSRRIKDFANAVMSQNQQRNDAFILTQNQHQIASVIPTRLPGDVTRASRGSQSNTWKPMWKLNQSNSLLNQQKASISN